MATRLKLFKKDTKVSRKDTMRCAPYIKSVQEAYIGFCEKETALLSQNTELSRYFVRVPESACEPTAASHTYDNSHCCHDNKNIHPTEHNIVIPKSL